MQWHPERNAFEWPTKAAINHSKEAILITQYVADFFVNQGNEFFVLNAAPFAALSAPLIKDALLVLFHDTVSCYVE